MTDTTTVAGGRAPGSPNTYNPFVGTSFPPGTPVRQDRTRDDTVLPGRADSAETTVLTGLAVNAGVESRTVRANRVLVQYEGPLTLTVAQWSEITGDPRGLIRGVPYFLSATEFGMLTTESPSRDGTFVAPVGVALSSTTLHILLSFPSRNSGGVITIASDPKSGSSVATASSSDEKPE